jgi:hypothetical protein
MSNQPRASGDGPFCWQSKAALRRIVDACEERTDLALIVSVYLVLTWIASDEQRERFTVAKSKIAQKAGVSYRKAAEAITHLEGLGLVTSEENLVAGSKERGPNTYTLRTVCLTSGTECLRLGTDAKTVPCRDSEKNLIEESFEESLKNVATAVPPKAKRAPARLPDGEWIASLKQDSAYAGIDIDRELAKCRRWCLENRKTFSRKRLTNWLNRVDRPISADAAKPQSKYHDAF